MTRESPIVQGNEGLRRNRKALLSDLSSLVKTAKRLQEYTASSDPTQSETDAVNDAIDEMILKAFKIVTRGVRFLDVLEDDIRQRHPPIQRFMATVTEEAYNPPTPPAESTSFTGSQHEDPASDAASRRSSSRSSASALSGSQKADEQTKRQSFNRMSSAYSNNAYSRPLSLSGPTSVNLKKQAVSHRLSLTAPVPPERRQNLVSERLSSGIDTFLSYLGSFIGRLHLQSQSSSDLLETIRQSVTAGRELLMVVEIVCRHDTQSFEYLEPARQAVHERINKLISSARDIMASEELGDEGVVMPQQSGGLLMAATGCVKAAGECVHKTKFVIERIGDFEFEPQTHGLGIDVDSIGAVIEVQTDAISVPTDPTEEVVAPSEPASRPPPPPLIIPKIGRAHV